MKNNTIATLLSLGDSLLDHSVTLIARRLEQPFKSEIAMNQPSNRNVRELREEREKSETWNMLKRLAMMLLVAAISDRFNKKKR